MVTRVVGFAAVVVLLLAPATLIAQPEPVPGPGAQPPPPATVVPPAPGPPPGVVYGPPPMSGPRYQIFRFDLHAIFPISHGTKGWGHGIALEPKFNVLDKLAVGLRTEAAVMGGGSVGPNSASVSLTAYTSLLAKVDYYFTHAPIRPFVALGLGLIYLASVSTATNLAGTSVSEGAGTCFGLSPQAGIELGAFRLAVTYHAIIGAMAEATVRLSTGETQIDKASRNMILIELGGRIGGKRRY
jgi:hypothetical protein